jgi:hypothetical protein
MDDVEVIRFVAMDTISTKEYHGQRDRESEKVRRGSVVQKIIRETREFERRL